MSSQFKVDIWSARPADFLGQFQRRETVPTEMSHGAVLVSIP